MPVGAAVVGEPVGAAVVGDEAVGEALGNAVVGDGVGDETGDETGCEIGDETGFETGSAGAPPQSQMEPNEAAGDDGGWPVVHAVWSSTFSSSTQSV